MIKNLYYLSEKCLEKESKKDLGPFIDKILKDRDFYVEKCDVEDALKVIRMCTEFFIEANFTGNIPQQDTVKESLGTAVEDCIQEIDEYITAGEQMNENVLFPKLYFLARKTCDLCRNQNQFEILVWRMRLLCLGQQVTDELSGSLYEAFQRVTEMLIQNPDFPHDSAEESALLHLEIAQGYVIFRRVRKSREFLDKVKEKLQTELTIASLLGMRTRFQTKPLPQMMLKITMGSLPLSTASESHGLCALPKLLQLDDDTRLEKIKFIDEEAAKIGNLPAIVQCLIAVELQWLQISQPKDNLAEEELQPYIETLLHQDCGPWSVRIAALLANIEVEAKNRRTVDRSLKQCEEIQKLTTSPAGEPNLRLLNFFTSGMLPIWRVEMLLGNIMMSLGLVKSALDVFLRIQAWEEVIVCYNMLELRHKAEEMIRQELQKKPTVKLYCLLGDATDDPAWYEKAWEFSGKRSGRAQRHWGTYFFARKDYASALPHLQQSLELNSLQESLWLRLGFAALELEQWSVAANAYQRYTHLEGNTFEAWNNMAKAYVKMGDKERAHRVLAEAIKCNFDVWQVWENFMVVSLDTGHFDDVLNAYGRLIELKKRHEDRQVLDIVTAAIEKHVPDQKGVDSHHLAEKAGKLLAQLCVQHGREGFYWEMAARVAKDNLSKARKLLKSYTGYTHSNSKWHEYPESCSKIMKLCLEMSQLFLAAFDGEISVENRSLAMSELASARLSAQSCIRLVKEVPEDLAEIHNELSQNLAKITEKLKEFSK
ncbi:tetratricopeptide repeat protein 27 [Lutzomyia longipalpis]|nr:tetratricopeptide repeat protein 27 [Lutzomyia longipalpis]